MYMYLFGTNVKTLLKGNTLQQTVRNSLKYFTHQVQTKTSHAWVLRLHLSLWLSTGSGLHGHFSSSFLCPEHLRPVPPSSLKLPFLPLALTCVLGRARRAESCILGVKLELRNK